MVSQKTFGATRAQRPPARATIGPLLPVRPPEVMITGSYWKQWTYGHNTDVDADIDWTQTSRPSCTLTRDFHIQYIPQQTSALLGETILFWDVLARISFSDVTGTGEGYPLGVFLGCWQPVLILGGYNYLRPECHKLPRLKLEPFAFWEPWFGLGQILRGMMTKGINVLYPELPRAAWLSARHSGNSGRWFLHTRLMTVQASPQYFTNHNLIQL